MDSGGRLAYCLTRQDMGYNKIISYGNTLEVYEYEKEIYRMVGGTSRKGKVASSDPGMDTRRKDPFSEADQAIWVGKRSDNARRSSMAFRRLVASNLGGSTRPILVTLTYRDNFTDLSGAYKHHSTFVQSLRYKFGKNFKYISVPEFQKRGAVHFHALFWGLPETVLLSERETREIAGIWGHGFVFLKETDGNDKLARYLTKYMSKAFVDPRLKNQKAYASSRNVLRPLVQTNVPVDYVLEDYRAVGDPVVDRTFYTNWLGEGRYRIFKTEP